MARETMVYPFIYASTTKTTNILPRENYQLYSILGIVAWETTNWLCFALIIIASFLVNMSPVE